MTTEKISQNNVCEVQLLTALRMYREKNYVSAITLAGAAEEILGKIIRSKGLPTTYDLIKGIINNTSNQLHRAEFNNKEFNEIANSARNQLKHFSSDGCMEIDLKQEAVNIIHRAVYNYENAIGYMPKEAVSWLKEIDLHPQWPIKQA